MSRKKIVKGISLEIEKSRIVHGESVPLLICPTMLRRLGCGQVDIAGIYKYNGEFIIRLFEVKSSGFMTNTQKQRLLNSAHFISSYFEISCTVSLV
ncbi:hypothetical protein [Bacteriovorax sp. BAL6_X]|uniref:hypothetical protein n=1 Tax=Bacteriovorax sp. BAL6_X TaxID=1201290 RepID=UPI00058CBC57|nr:hypothetical protein [Bacteriovorax sp. BAL6_X]